MSVAYRLLSRLEDVGDCWVWRGARSSNGYGRIWDGKASQYAHIASFRLHKGLSPQGLVRHTCDNRLCVNPDHLVDGSHDDNMRDMVVRGRSAKGEGHSQVKLTAHAVREIRAMIEGPTRAARMYGVAPATICDIRKGRSWAHVV